MRGLDAGRSGGFLILEWGWMVGGVGCGRGMHAPTDQRSYDQLLIDPVRARIPRPQSPNDAD